MFKPNVRLHGIDLKNKDGRISNRKGLVVDTLPDDFQSLKEYFNGLSFAELDTSEGAEYGFYVIFENPFTHTSYFISHIYNKQGQVHWYGGSLNDSCFSYFSNSIRLKDSGAEVYKLWLTHCVSP
jgi:hypothetical protein